METPKPDLPEHEDAIIYNESKKALLEYELLNNDYSTENAIQFIQKYYETWTLIDLVLSSSVPEKFNVEGSNILAFYETYAALSKKLYKELGLLN